MLFGRRITIFVGHFGSGKTEIAVNSALSLAAAKTPVALVDLDIVKPYFRSRSAREVMTAAGVTLIAPEGERFYADLPIIVPQIRSAVRGGSGKLLMDAGGDDTGARVLGSLKDVIRPDEVDHLLVLNFRRPFNETVDAALRMLAEIETSSRLRVTGLISNTHLMAETTLELIEEGLGLARETAERAGLPLVALGAEERFVPEAEELGLPVVALRRQIRPDFDEPSRPRTMGPLFVMN